MVWIANWYGFYWVGHTGSRIGTRVGWPLGDRWCLASAGLQIGWLVCYSVAGLQSRSSSPLVHWLLRDKAHCNLLWTQMRTCIEWTDDDDDDWTNKQAKWMRKNRQTSAGVLSKPTDLVQAIKSENHVLTISITMMGCCVVLLSSVLLLLLLLLLLLQHYDLSSCLCLCCCCCFAVFG